MMEFLHGSESLAQRAEHDDLECLDTIDSQVKLMNVLVNDALDLSKIEAGKMTFERIGFSMAKLVKATTAGQKSRAHAQGIALRTIIAPDIARWAYGDPTRIRQVLTNMLSNGQCHMHVPNAHVALVVFSSSAQALNSLCCFVCFLLFFQPSNSPTSVKSS
jgi:K+-sensing histidine kinase KdpD